MIRLMWCQLFTQIEGEIDEIYISKNGDQEWERSGMIYFMELCGNTTECVNNQTNAVESPCSRQRSDTTEVDAIDKSTPRSLHENLNTYSGDVGDKREEECSSFFDFL